MGFFFLWNTLRRRFFMNIIRLLKQNKTLCVAFPEEEKAEFSKKLFALGFFVTENFSSPAIIHRDKTVSAVNGFASGILFSQPAEKLKKYGILKLSFSEISSKNLRSGWYESRKSFLD